MNLVNWTHIYINLEVLLIVADQQRVIQNVWYNTRALEWFGLDVCILLV